ncbi:YjaG family protein [Thalassotalea piscium]
MAIDLPLNELSLWQKIAFSTALLERMLPNYKMFSQAAEFGDYPLLRNQVNLIWQRLDKTQKVKINYQAQLTKLEAQIPDPDAFDFFGVYPALDTSMAVMSLLQAMQDNEDDEGFIAVSRLSHNSVSFYLGLLLAQESENDDSPEISDEAIDQDPLMVWEKEMQKELFDFIKGANETKQTCERVKSIALSEGLSNLGIEFE